MRAFLTLVVAVFVAIGIGLAGFGLANDSVLVEGSGPVLQQLEHEVLGVASSPYLQLHIVIVDGADPSTTINKLSFVVAATSTDGSTDLDKSHNISGALVVSSLRKTLGEALIISKQLYVRLNIAQIPGAEGAAIGAIFGHGWDRFPVSSVPQKSVPNANKFANDFRSAIRLSFATAKLSTSTSAVGTVTEVTGANQDLVKPLLAFVREVTNTVRPGLFPNTMPRLKGGYKVRFISQNGSLSSIQLTDSAVNGFAATIVVSHLAEPITAPPNSRLLSPSFIKGLLGSSQLSAAARADHGAIAY